EGGQITAPGDDGEGNTVDYPGVYIQSVFPYQTDMSPMPSYEIENLPEWLSISSYNDQYYTKDYAWTTVVNIEAAPLPEGEDGRTATLRFVSEMGAKSKEFTVTQGTPIPSGINDIETVTEETGAVYNVAGQRVGKDYKGIVVKNGKKMIKF
ncbi:MAG: BACON domain-containing protein, partial [Prevotella sp.]|nr:BACON domain-containing protein [Prevotella sp.]